MFEKERKKKFITSLPHYFLKICKGFVKGFAPWILFDCFEESFYIHWSAGRSPRVHEVNPGRDPSTWYQSHGFENIINI